VVIVEGKNIGGHLGSGVALRVVPMCADRSDCQEMRQGQVDLVQ
jgi:hypothetical protein